MALRQIDAAGRMGATGRCGRFTLASEEPGILARVNRSCPPSIPDFPTSAG